MAIRSNKIIINSKDDLPKEDGYYFVKRKDTRGAGDGIIGFIDGIDNQFWLNKIEWYLIPDVPDKKLDNAFAEMEKAKDDIFKAIGMICKDYNQRKLNNDF